MELINQYAMVFVYALLVLQVLDALTTLYVLRTGKGAEANPIAKKLMAAFGPEFTVLMVKAALAGAIWTFRGTTPAWVYAGLCAVYLYVVINNMKYVLRDK